MNLNADSSLVLPGYSTVTFDADDFKGVQNHEVSSVNAMYWGCLEELQIPNDGLKNFPGILAEVCEYLDLPTTFGYPTREKIITLQYMIIKEPSTYNMILGRPTINILAAVISYPQLCMKFPLLDGRTGTIRGDQETARNCYAESAKVQTVQDEAMQP